MQAWQQPVKIRYPRRYRGYCSMHTAAKFNPISLSSRTNCPFSPLKMPRGHLFFWWNLYFCSRLRSVSYFTPSLTHVQEHLSSFQRAWGALERMSSSLVFIFFLMAHCAPVVWVPEYSVGLNRGLLVTSENTWNNSIYGMTVTCSKHVQLHSQKHWSTNGRWKTEPGVHVFLFFLNLKRQSINSSDTNQVKHTIGAALQPNPKAFWCLIQYLESEMRWKGVRVFKYVHSGSLSKATWK